MLKKDRIPHNNGQNLQNLSLNVRVQHQNQEKIMKEEKGLVREKGVVQAKRHK